MNLFFLFITLIILQRMVELVIAKRNEHRMKSQGAMEFGKEHYRWIVLVHSLFFVSYILEVLILHKQLSPVWPVVLALLLMTQAARVWALMSLGMFWNTKIIVLPNAKVVRKGPYRYIKHPNYVIVAAEFLLIPLLFQAYVTAILFSILNAVILAVRIPAEEKALRSLTEYERVFADSSVISDDLERI
jgi:methyltransferase